MAQIIQFIPKREADAIENVSAFIEESKIWNVFGNNVDWDAPRWDMNEHIEYRTGLPPAINWTNFDTPRGRASKAPLLQQPVLDFAKAYITYKQGLKPTKTYSRTLFMIRALERALCNRYKKPCITKVDHNVLNAAQKLLYDKDKTDHKKNSSHLCRELQYLSDFLNEHCMLRTPPFAWRRSIKSYNPSTTVGDDYKKYSAEKLPTDTCIYALADIYNTTENPIYKLATAFSLLLFSNPCRIGEVLTLENDCLIHDHQAKLGALAMRWFPEKGAEPFIKSIMPSWRTLVINGVTEIQKITCEARKIAKWYEDNPNKIYLPEKYEYLRDKKYLSTKEAKDLLSTPTLCKLFRGANITKKKTRGVHWLYPFSKVEQLVLSYLPAKLPYRLEEKKLKYSDSLFVVPKNFFKNNSTLFSEIMFEPIEYNHLANLFGINNRGNKRSMFDCLGFLEPDGSKIAFRSHSARHWNETTTEYASIDQNVRAAYAGRKHASQNIWYSHADKTITSRKALEVRDQSDIVPSNVDAGVDVYSQPEVMSALVKQHFNPTDAVFNEVKADVTNAGFCLLGLDQTCKKLHDHYLCSDHLYIKGDPRLDIIPFEIEKLESDNREWQKTVNGDKNPLVVRNGQIIQVLKNIMDILKDPQIPKGSFFRLAHGKDYSKTNVIYYEKNKKLLGAAKSGAIPLIKVGELCLNT